jgi:hypothetical protein
MRPDRAAPYSEMVGAGIELLTEGLIRLVDGYGLGTVEDGEEGKRLNFPDRQCGKLRAWL